MNPLVDQRGAAVERRPAAPVRCGVVLGRAVPLDAGRGDECAPEAAARRELHEEAGIDAHLARWEGPCWDRHWTWHWAQRGIWYASHEWFYLARLPVEGGDLGHPERIRLTDEEVLVLRDWRWWSLDELRAERPPTSPACLLDVLPALIEAGCPATPVPIGE